MRHFINFLISGIWIMLFQLMGWIEINKQIAPFDNVLANQLLVAIIVGLIFSIGLWVASIVFSLFIIVTLGYGCFLLPFYMALMGAIGFWAVELLLPGWVKMNSTTLQTIIMGCLIAWVRIPVTTTNAQRQNMPSQSS